MKKKSMACEEISEAEIIAGAITSGLKWLGNGNASTPMGAIEAHGKSILDSATLIADALHDVADAIRRLKDCE
jgi:hypothetical protein